MAPACFPPPPNSGHLPPPRCRADRAVGRHLPAAARDTVVVGRHLPAAARGPSVAAPPPHSAGQATHSPVAQFNLAGQRGPARRPDSNPTRHPARPSSSTRSGRRRLLPNPSGGASHDNRSRRRSPPPGYPLCARNRSCPSSSGTEEHKEEAPAPGGAEQGRRHQEQLGAPQPATSSLLAPTEWAVPHTPWRAGTDPPPPPTSTPCMIPRIPSPPDCLAPLQAPSATSRAPSPCSP